MCRTQSFLYKKEVGDDEIFYLHTVLYYIPKMAFETRTTRRASTGMYTMQGFERIKMNLKMHLEDSMTINHKICHRILKDYGIYLQLIIIVFIIQLHLEYIIGVLLGVLM